MGLPVERLVMFPSPGVRAPLLHVVRPARQEGLPWMDADALPAVHEVRVAAMGVARGILETRVRQLCEGEFDSVINPVDPLTTAGRALEAKRQYGQDSEQYRRAYSSLLVDSQRLFAEAMRKHTWEYFPETEQSYDAASGDFTFMDRSLTDMVADGISPIAESEEQDYRLGEYVEEATYGAVRRLGRLSIGNVVLLGPARPSLIPGLPRRQVRVNTISECADWAILAYKRGSKAGYGGYVPENEKLMLRGVRFDTETGHRYQEQVGLPGTYIVHAVVEEALRRRKVLAPGETLTKQETRAKQLININDEGVLAFARLLDEVASEMSGKRIFMGEPVADDHQRDYAVIPAQAAARQELLAKESHELAEFLMTLEASGMDHWEAQGLVQHYVDEVVFEKVKSDPRRAAEAFDKKTARTLERAAERRAMGDEQGARRLELQAKREAPPTVFCGGGSCGLETPDPENAETAEAAKLLEVGEGDTLVAAPNMPCPHCGAVGSVYFSYDSKKVNKGCLNCKIVEKNGKQEKPKKLDKH